MKPKPRNRNDEARIDAQTPVQPPPANGKPAVRPPLPMMGSFDDAEALAVSQKDPFYLAAFLFQIWLSGLVLRATAEYAEKKNPKERSLQNGEAWRSFLELFPFAPKKGFGYLLTCLARFAATDDAPGNSLRRTLVPLSIERYPPRRFPQLDNSQLSTINYRPTRPSCSQPSTLNHQPNRSLHSLIGVI